MSSNLVIQVDSLSKSYDRPALDGLTFQVPRGSICGFLGPNGAGKTTTLRILMGFAQADQGGAEMLGIRCRRGQTPDARVAFVPEVKELFPFARVGEMIRLTRGLYPSWDHALEARLLRELRIAPSQWCKHLSKGGRTSLAILLALCRGADLLLLDEPSEGLDPIATERVLRLLVEQVAERHCTVFFSTHALGEVEQIADRVVMVNRGLCVLQGALDELQVRHQRVRCQLAADDAPLPASVAGWRREGRVIVGFSDDPHQLAERLAGTGTVVLDSQPATLKELFFERVQEMENL